MPFKMISTAIGANAWETVADGAQHLGWATCVPTKMMTLLLDVPGPYAQQQHGVASTRSAGRGSTHVTYPASMHLIVRCKPVYNRIRMAWGAGCHLTLHHYASGVEYQL